MISINIKEEELIKIAKVSGIFGIGVITGLSMLKRAKKQLKKEIIDENNEQIKNEIINEIKSNIQLNDIKNEIIDNSKQSMINDILSESNNRINDFKKDVSSKIQIFENELEHAKSNVFDIDKRIGKIITNSATSLYNTINTEK